MRFTSQTANFKYLTGFLNSKVSHKWIKEHCSELQGGTRELSKVFFENIPIPPITDANSSLVNKMKTLVDEMLSTQKLLHSSKTEADKKLYQTKASAIDKKIDEIVYKLYGLTDEEIKIVENSF